MYIIHSKTFRQYEIPVYKKNENVAFPKFSFLLLGKTDSEAYVIHHHRGPASKQIAGKMLCFIRNAGTVPGKIKSPHYRSQGSFVCKGQGRVGRTPFPIILALIRTFYPPSVQPRRETEFG